MISALNEAFLQLTKRAEVSAGQKLLETFVQVGPLVPMLSSKDHQVFYGRRGTGKTHALTFLLQTVKKSGDVGVYVDMRTVGSSVGLYGDPNTPLPERATRLILDLLGHVHTALFTEAVDGTDFDLSELGPSLDRLADEVTRVQIRGNVEEESTQRTSAVSRSSQELRAEAALNKLGGTASLGSQSEQANEHQTRKVESGSRFHYLSFAGLSTAFGEVLKHLLGKRLWLLIDEWSSIPLDLQPILGDLIRRALLPVPGLTIKIAAIEHRSRFQNLLRPGEYQGIELGADVSAALNLDDYLVFNNDADAAKSFFRELLFKHVVAEMQDKAKSQIPKTPEALQHAAFTQHNAFEEIVRAAEGVPRDAINIIAIAAQRAADRAISVQDARAAATTWYKRDKESAVTSNPEAKRLLYWIIDEVIGKRRARAFLLASDTSHPLIDSLFDARVLHVLKRGVSSNERPGARFDVYGLDFGCYADLMTTAKRPQGLLPADGEDGTETFVDVPADDYRSIRRAVLQLREFEGETQSREQRNETS